MLDNTDATVLDILSDFTEVVDRGAPLRLPLCDRATLAGTLEGEFNIVIPDAWLESRFGTIASILASVNELTDH